MKAISSSLLLAALFLYLTACNSSEPKTEKVPETAKMARLLCTDSLHPELPRGEVIYVNPDSTTRSYSSIELGKDSLFWFNYEKDMADSNLYTSVEKIVMAFKDIDTATIETTEGDIELTTGGSIHSTGFFVRAINEEKRFKSIDFSCQDQNGVQNNYDVHTCNISTSNIETARKWVEKLKTLLTKKP